MRPIDADELMEHVGRDRLDSRELIEQMIANAPTLEQKDPIDMSADDLTDLARKYKVRIEIEFEPDGYGKVRRKMTIEPWEEYQPYCPQGVPIVTVKERGGS